jgi:hypothetical protein
MITSEAVRRKVHTWVVMSNMLDVGKIELIARAPKIVARYVRSFSYAVSKALKLDRAELPFEKVLVELRLLDSAFRSLRLPGQQYVTDVCNVYSRLVSAIKQNPPEQMRLLRVGTLPVHEERYKFHDEHVFDFLALKAFVFSKVSSDVENKFSLIRKDIPMKSTYVGKYDTVIIDKGARENLKPGDVFGIVRPGAEVVDNGPDNVAYEQDSSIGQKLMNKQSTVLSADHIGEVMVIKVYQKTSLAIVMNSRDMVRAGYVVENP